MANSEYRGSASNVGAAKKKAATTKTTSTPGTKVSQATIDKIKSMGMSAALKSAKSASPEMREGIRRMYGASRYNAAVAGTGRSASSSTAASRAGMGRASKGMPETAPGTRSSKPKLGAKTVMAPSNPNRQNMPNKTSSAKPVQKDMYGNTVKSSVTVSSKKNTPSTPSKKTGYKAGTQKDMYGNKIK